MKKDYHQLFWKPSIYCVTLHLIFIDTYRDYLLFLDISRHNQVLELYKSKSSQIRLN